MRQERDDSATPERPKSDEAVRVKICGVTNVEDALAALEAGAASIGLNFHPSSPRFVTMEQAKRIVRVLPRGVSLVGVFVNRETSEVARTAHALDLPVVQLHGDEPPEDLRELREQFLTIRAFRLADGDSVNRMLAYLRRADEIDGTPYATLIDAHVPGIPGGTGKSIGDDILLSLPNMDHLILAGGLTPENVADRVARLRPWMVDVAGGVESAPGKKDPTKMAAFVKAARGA
jgi:phosphoribosylanthranilate isomerase